jgi:hypothetical protein
MSEATMIWSIGAAVIGSLGGGAALVLVFSSWLGTVWATRMADAERARFARELEGFRHELRQLADEQSDALTRKRDMYARLATTMRVFLSSAKPASTEDKREFLAALDLAALWASEDVAAALSSFLEHSVRNTNQPGSVSNEEFKNAYRACLNAMRKDCGFPNTRFSYPVVAFRN